MPNPYFLDAPEPLSRDRLILQAFSLLALLLLSILVVRMITRPLATLSDAAGFFVKGDFSLASPEAGSQECVTTARALAGMREPLIRHVADRKWLSIPVSPY